MSFTSFSLKKAAWLISALFITLFFILPVSSIVYESFFAEWHNMQHLWQTALSTYAYNSFLLVFFTLIFSLIFALPSAWFVSNYQFWGQKHLQWLLCIPLAMPAYLAGYFYTEFLDYTGPVQIFLRQLFGWTNIHDYWFPEIRSIGGASFVLGLVLYPYLFLLVRLAFLEQGETLIQSAKLLGANKRKIWLKIIFPLIRPAIVVGCALIAMETLGDFGTVAYFSIPTLTTAVFDTWLGFGDLGSASQISVFILLMIFSLLLIERYSRRKQKTYQNHHSERRPLRKLKGLSAIFVPLFCWGLVGIAFFVPLARFTYWAFKDFSLEQVDRFSEYAYHSLSVSIVAAVACVGLALVLHFFRRIAQQYGLFMQKSAYYSMQLSSLSYAVPGTVLAIGILIPYTFLDHKVDALLTALGLPSVGLIFSGSMLGLVSAYIIRFGALAIGSIDTSMQKIPPTLDYASQTLGFNGWKMLTKIHLPLLNKGIFTALLMVFIESMKELNASLLLRPFNFDTLATYVFAFTSDEQLEQAALPALALILVGLVPVIWLTRALVLQTQKG